MNAPPTHPLDVECLACDGRDPDCAAGCKWGVAPCGCGMAALRECPHDDDRTQDDRDTAALDRETE